MNRENYPHQQERAWELEYRNPVMLSPSNTPLADVMRFVKWLKKKYRREESRLDFDSLTVLDLGSGTGRNALYFAESGATVIGYEISETAIATARKFAQESTLTVNVTYEKRDIGSRYPLADNSIGLILDATSSNSLTDAARKIYLEECARVLKPGGYFFVRTLCKDGDVNAKELLARNPGPEENMYLHPDVGIAERVFSREEFEKLYSEKFVILNLEKTMHYNTIGGRKYKRNYWVSYLQRKEEGMEIKERN
jgi:SAM-dependent methyltransferase